MKLTHYLKEKEIKKHRELSFDKAIEIGTKLGVDWAKIPKKEFHMGMNVELEHGTVDPDTNITNDDDIMTGKIVWIHLKESDVYYTDLKKIEGGSTEVVKN